jgi:hydroxyacylglutathione hydrolase
MQILAISCNFDNYSYLLIDEQRGEAAVIDPAEYYPVARALTEKHVQLKGIYCTHHHGDHIGGLADLVEEFPGIAVFGHERDRRRIPSLNRPLADNAALTFGGLKGQVLYTPGHTMGSVCYLFADALFTGDTLFGAGCGRLFEGSPEQMLHSLNRLKKLPPATRVYFGHEYTAHNLKFAGFVDAANRQVTKRQQEVTELRQAGGFTTPSTLALELATNPFLRTEEPGIQKSMAPKLYPDPPESLAVFRALRELRDGF